MVMDDDSDLGSVLESSRGMDGSDEDGSAGGCRRGRRRDSDEPNELGVFSMFATTAPERGEGERPATVRGMVWRTVLLFAWYVGVYVANIWYYRLVMASTSVRVWPYCRGSGFVGTTLGWGIGEVPSSGSWSSCSAPAPLCMYPLF